MTANLQLQPPPQLPIRAFSAADRACDVASDALCDDPVGPLDPPPPPPRQRRRFPRIRTPSIAESPVGPKPCPARSSTSATQTLRQHHHAIDRSPRTEPSFERALSRSALGMEAFASLLGYRWPPPRPLTGKPPGSHDPERRPCSADACARLCVERALRPPTEASRARSHRLSPDGLPQPDPLGHLLSWNHIAAGWRLRPCLRSHRGPPHPGFREEDRDSLHPRCLPSTNRLARSSSAEASPPWTESPPWKDRLSPGIRSYPQLVTKMWRTPVPSRHSSALCAPPRSAALDEAAAARSGLRLRRRNDLRQVTIVWSFHGLPHSSRTTDTRIPSAPVDFCDRNDPRLDVPQNFQVRKSLFRHFFATEKSWGGLLLFSTRLSTTYALYGRPDNRHLADAFPHTSLMRVCA